MYIKLVHFAGKQIGELVDELMGQNSDVHHLHITGDTLVVPRLDERKVYYYNLN